MAAMFDTHAHIISDDLVAYPPSPISGRVRPGALSDPITAERLIEAMDEHGVAYAALVQRAHLYGYDNSYVVDAAVRYPERFRAICVVDSTAPDAPSKAKEWLGRGAAGIRLTEPMRDADGVWLWGPAARGVWEVVAEQGATISIQLYTWNRAARLPEIPAIAGAFASVPVIIEHLSNMTETDTAPDYGIDAALAGLAELDNVILKLTTINLARCANADIDAGAVLRRLIELFSPERLLWGSDVAQSPQSYATMIAMARAAVAGLPAAARDAALVGNARALFWT